MTVDIASRLMPAVDKKQAELGDVLAPKFDGEGLVPAIAVDAASGVVLMMAYMNREALAETIATGRAVYFSRSRRKLWRKGEESGNVQMVRQILVDCDQDTLVLKVEQIGGAACHVGYQSCFYRAVAPADRQPTAGPLKLVHIGGERVFDPGAVYGKS